MAILNAITVGNQLIIISDTDPSTGGGISAPVGSLILMDDGSGSYIKSNTSDTDWKKSITLDNLSAISAVGTITSGTWNGTAISAAYGGTGQTTYNIGDTLYASTSNTLSKLPIGSTGHVLTVVGGVPAWSSAAAGTVTAVSVVSANGFAGTVANASSTPAITLTTTITGLLKGNGTSISAATDADVTGKLLTGYVSGAGTVSATDSILQAIQKLNGNITLVTGAVVYQGTWDASTNTPTLTSGVGTKGYMYKVSVSGSTTLDGNSTWRAGDQLIFNGTTWDAIDGSTAEVSSVNSQVGAVTLTGTTNRITVSGTTWDIAATYVGQTSITTLGTITTGIWNGSAIGNAYLSNSSVTIGSTNISLGATSTTLAGLTSVTSTSFIGALTGNASTATALQTARTINGVSFDGTANITVTAAAGTLTGTTLNSSVVSSSLTSVGTISTGVWNGTLIGVNYGGTGTSTAFTSGSLIYAGASGVYSQNNSNLFWDNTNVRLGIKIAAAPVKTLHVGGDVRIEPTTSVTKDVTGATVNTTNATLTTLETISIPTDTVVLIETRVHSRKTGGAGVGTIGDGNAYIRTVKAKNVGGTVTIGTISSTFTSEDINQFNATLAVSGTNVLVQVTGAVNDNVTWTSITTTTK